MEMTTMEELDRLDGRLDDLEPVVRALCRIVSARPGILKLTREEAEEFNKAASYCRPCRDYLIRR